MQPDQVWFTPKEAAQYTRLSVETLAQWRWQGKGPQFVRRLHPGGRKPIIRYHCDELDRWLTDGRS